MVAVAESMWFAQAGVTNNTDSPNIAYKTAEDRRDIMACSFRLFGWNAIVGFAFSSPSKRVKRL
jgi:hypothetical protein